MDEQLDPGRERAGALDRVRELKLRARGHKLVGPAVKLALVAGLTLLLMPVQGAPAQALGGVVPDVANGGQAQAPAAGAPEISARSAPVARIARLGYQGGPVLHRNRTHLIFWQPSGSKLTFDAGYTALMVRFLQNVAADSHLFTNVYSLSGQYHDQSGPAAYNSFYGGSLLDTDPLPANGCREPPPPLLGGTGPGWTVCLTSSQLDAELDHVVAAHHLPTAKRDIYFLVLPNGFGNCEQSGPQDCADGGASNGGYCAYHTVSLVGIPYAVIPYNAVSGHCQSGDPRPNSSTADPALSNVSHEHNEMVTDPLGNAWINSDGSEDGDLCLTYFGPALGGSGGSAYDEVIHGGHYWLQEEYSDEDGGCAARAKPDHISFKVKRHGRRVKLVGHGYAAHGRIVSYAWFFGDGKHGARRVTSHTFKRKGVYRVTLRSTDNDGLWAFAVKTIRVR